MKSLFFLYTRIRLRLFLREILQLHQRFLIGFLLFFGLILSGNEQLAIREAMAHLVSNVRCSHTDTAVLITILLYALTAAAAVRKSARGGRAHYLVESLPLPFTWERCVRMIKLTIINLTVLTLFLMGFGQLLQEKASLGRSPLLFAAYYIWILGLQLSLLEQSWRTFPLWIAGALLLMFSRDTQAFPWCLLLTIGVAFFALRSHEARLHEHPGWSIRSVRARWRSRLIRHLPPQILMQVSYILVRPGAFFYTILIACGVNMLLLKILRQEIPVSQKIYVYACVTGFFCLMLGSFFRNFYQARLEWQIWLTSLPQPASWWIRQDTLFVLTIYSVLAIPVTLMAILNQSLFWPIPLIVLPIHFLSFLAIRRIQRSQRLESALFLMIGSAFWFVLIGYIAEHLLRGLL